MKNKYRLLRVDMVKDLRKGFKEEVKITYYESLSSVRIAKKKHEYNHDFCIAQKNYKGKWVKLI